MASANACWGIEVGASSVKALKLEATGDGKVKVVDYAIVQHAKPLSTPGVDANDVIRVSLGQLASQLDLSKASVAVSVPGHAAFARFAKLPPVEPKKVPDIVKFEAMQQIPFPLEEVEWDYQTFVTPDSPEIEVGIFAIHRDRVMERLAMLQDVGITPSHIVLSPIAVYNALAYDLDFDTNTPGTIIVDVGTTSTDLVVATPGRVWVRTFPVGGHQFTEALVEAFQLTYPKAEKLKREAEDAKHARQVLQAMRPVFTDLAQDIQRSIGYFQSLNKDANLTRLIGVGATFELPGLRKFLKQQLGMDVYRIENFKKAEVDADRAHALNTASLQLCTCYGLALQGLELNTVGGNLMPVSVVRESMWKEKVPWFGLAAGLAVASSVTMFARPWMDKIAIDANPPGQIIASVMRQFSEQKQQAEEAKVLDAGQPDLRAANAVALFEKRDTVPAILGDAMKLFEIADAKAKGWPSLMQIKNPDGSLMSDVAGSAFKIENLDTNFIPPDPPADPFATPDGSEANKDPLKIGAYPRVECVLEVTTNQPESRQFVKRVVDEWRARVEQDKLRSGFDYVVKCEELCYEVSEAGKPEDAPPGERPGDGRGRGRGAMRGGAGPADGDSPMVVRRTREEERAVQQARARGGEIVGGGPSPRRSKEDGDIAAAAAQLEGLAPVGDDGHEDASKMSRITVRWFAVFMPSEALGGGENGGVK